MSRLLFLIFAFHATFSNALTSPVIIHKMQNAPAQTSAARASGLEPNTLEESEPANSVGSVTAAHPKSNLAQPLGPRDADEVVSHAPMSPSMYQTSAAVSEAGSVMPPIDFENEDPQSEEDEKASRMLQLLSQPYEKASMRRSLAVPHDVDMVDTE